MKPSADLTADQRGHIANRWLEYEGELRVGLVRVILLTLFYAAQLWHFAMLGEASQQAQQFHRHVTYLSAIWMFVSLTVVVAVARQWLPPSLKYCVTLLDLLLLVAMAAGGGGPHSPLVFVLPLIVLLAGLRANLKLIWMASAGSLAGYFFLVYWQQRKGEASPAVIEQVVIALVLAATGAAVGQLVRMMRQILIDAYATRTSVPTTGGQS